MKVMDQSLWINTVEQTFAYIVINSDSVGALQSIRDTSTRALPRLLIDVMEPLHDLHVNDHKGVQFVWIPAYMNIAGHDAADRAAKHVIVAGGRVKRRH